MKLPYGQLPTQEKFNELHLAKFGNKPYLDKIRTHKPKEYTRDELWDEIQLAMKEHKENYTMFSRMWVAGIMEEIGINWDWILVQPLKEFKK